MRLKFDSQSSQHDLNHRVVPAMTFVKGRRPPNIVLSLSANFHRSLPNSILLSFSALLLFLVFVSCWHRTVL